MPKIGFIVEGFQSKRAADFEWCFSYFPTLCVIRGCWLESPSFYFARIHWRLYFRKKGKSKCIVVLSPKKSTSRSHFSTEIHYWLGVQRVDGVQKKIGSGRVIPKFHPDYEHLPPPEYQSWHECHARHYYKWLPFEELERRTGILEPSGTLRFIIRLQSGPKTDNEISSLNEGKNPTSSTEARIRSGLDDSLLIEHFRNHLLHADDHDVVIKVKGKEFKAHKSILRARSPVFQGMFNKKYNMKENMEDTVIIEDMDPDCFGDFLMYVYTGKVENLSAANAMGLFYAGDKYDFPALKTRCLNVLKASLSISTVCDIITIAITHAEEELLEIGMAYVTCHLEELLETPKWQQFFLTNPLQANEISLKALKRRQASRNQKLGLFECN